MQSNESKNVSCTHKKSVKNKIDLSSIYSSLHKLYHTPPRKQKEFHLLFQKRNGIDEMHLIPDCCQDRVTCDKYYC